MFEQLLDRYKLFAIDLDGTFFDNNTKPHPDNVLAVQALIDAGMLVMLCTGRGRVESLDAINALTGLGPMVTLSGALINDPYTGKSISSCDIQPALASKIANCIAKDDHSVLFFTDIDRSNYHYYIYNPDKLLPASLNWIQQTAAQNLIIDSLDPEQLKYVLRIGTLGQQEEILPLIDEIKEQFGDEVFTHHFDFMEYLIEVFHKDSNKWQALLKVAAQHDIKPSEIITIGDQINDLAMVENAGLGIAMGNAIPEVKAAAKYISKPNTEGGVAYAIEQLRLGNWQ